MPVLLRSAPVWLHSDHCQMLRKLVFRHYFSIQQPFKLGHSPDWRKTADASSSSMKVRHKKGQSSSVWPLGHSCRAVQHQPVIGTAGLRWKRGLLQCDATFDPNPSLNTEPAKTSKRCQLTFSLSDSEPSQPMTGWGFTMRGLKLHLTPKERLRHSWKHWGRSCATSCS